MMRIINLNGPGMKWGGTALLALSVMVSGACKKGGEAGAAKDESIANKGQTRYISTKSGLRMRASADTKGKKVALIPGGDAVSVVAEKKSVVNIGGKSGVWTRVKWAGKEGWVFGYYLSARPPVSDEPPPGGDPYGGPYGGDPYGDPYGGDPYGGP